MGEFMHIANKDELKAGECKIVQVNGTTVALYNVDGKYYVTQNDCLHQGGPLGDGELSGNVVTCPWHGWQYDVTTGKNAWGTAAKLETFEVQVQGDEIQIKL